MNDLFTYSFLMSNLIANEIYNQVAGCCGDTAFDHFGLFPYLSALAAAFSQVR